MRNPCLCLGYCQLLHEALLNTWALGSDERVDSMTHTIDQSLAVKGFPYSKSYSDKLLPHPHQSSRTHGLRYPASSHDLDIGTTVLGSLQRRKRCCHYGISVGSGRSYDSGSEGGVVTAAVLHMQHQCGIQYLASSSVYCLSGRSIINRFSAVEASSADDVCTYLIIE